MNNLTLAAEKQRKQTLWCFGVMVLLAVVHHFKPAFTLLPVFGLAAAIAVGLIIYYGWIKQEISSGRYSTATGGWAIVVSFVWLFALVLITIAWHL